MPLEGIGYYKDIDQIMGKFTEPQVIKSEKSESYSTERVTQKGRGGKENRGEFRSGKLVLVIDIVHVISGIRRDIFRRNVRIKVRLKVQRGRLQLNGEYLSSERRFRSHRGVRDQVVSDEGMQQSQVPSLSE